MCPRTNTKSSLTIGPVGRFQIVDPSWATTTQLIVQRPTYNNTPIFSVRHTRMRKKKFRRDRPFRSSHGISTVPYPWSAASPLRADDTQARASVRIPQRERHTAPEPSSPENCSLCDRQSSSGSAYNFRPILSELRKKKCPTCPIEVQVRTLTGTLRALQSAMSKSP